MATNTSIVYATKTLGLAFGCSRKDAGCTHCYAERWCHRMAGNEKVAYLYQGITEKTDGGQIRFNGNINIHWKALEAPEKWKKPERIFVNTCSDFFHENMPIGAQNAAWSMMSRTPRHKYLIFTKRPENVLEMLPDDWNVPGRFDHVWIMVSIANQVIFDKAFYLLYGLKACGVRNIGISFEPLVGDITLPPGKMPFKWAIIGGESGPGARMCEVDWIVNLVQQCKQAGVSVYVKQLGKFLAKAFGLSDAKGENIEEWDTLKLAWLADLKTREFPFEI